MLGATMAPFLADLALHGWQRSRARRRGLVVSAIVVGYLSAWSFAGLVIVPGALILAVTAGRTAWLIAPAIAVLWWFAPLRRSAVRRCHRRPALAAFGISAGTTAMAAGLRLGGWCALGCGPWMLAALAAPIDHDITMLGVACMAGAERFGFIRTGARA